MIIDEKKIREQIDKASDNIGLFFGLSYEEGIKAALEWVLEDTDIKPMDE